MALYIGSTPYSRDASMTTYIDALAKLPSPLPDVRTDYDPEIYTVEQSNGPDLLIKKNGRFTTYTINGKNGYVFSKRSKFVEDAYSVHQGEAGFATIDKMGTQNVQDCVALIIQDKKTQKTALAHIDSGTKENAIKSMLSYFAKGDKEVILIGGRYERGKYNVEKILRVLANLDDNVFINKSYICNGAYLHDQDGQFMESCYELNTSFGDIVVEPKSLEITCGSTGKRFPQSPLPTEEENSSSAHPFSILLH